MNVFLFGATGATGTAVLKLLLENNHHVKVLVRNPTAINFLSSPKLSVLEGDVFNPNSYQEALEGVDAVISTLGTGTKRVPTTVYSKGGFNIISAMRKTGVKRLVVLTAAAFDQTDPGNEKFIVKFIVRPLFKNIYADMISFENLLEKYNDIDWVCIRPTRLTSGGFTGKYRTKLNHCPNGGGKISRKDLADFIVKQLTSAEYIHQKPVVAY